MSKYARRQDSNHREVVEALRAAGVYVYDTSRVGGGFPDLLCVHRGTVTLLEVKDGSLSPSRRKLTPAEEQFHSGYPARCFVVHCPEDALRVVVGEGREAA